MFLNYKGNLPERSRIFACFALAIILLCGAVTVADAQTGKGTYLDFNGDGKTDWAVIRTPRTPAENYRWKIMANQAISAQNPPFIRIFDYGLISDILLPGDYIGDRKTDVTVWRPEQQSIFYVAQFPIGTGGITLDRTVQWGMGGLNRDSALSPGDYDGDGKMDYTVIRSTTAGPVWYILSSSTFTWRSVAFGFYGNGSGGRLPGADFTGDGRDELVFTYNVNGQLTYYIGDAITGALVSVAPWGLSESYIDSNLPPADYTGDGKADLIAVRKSGSRLLWYILDLAANKYTVTEFGFGRARPEGGREDYPVQGDFDGDSKFDIAVYRYSNQTFYVLKSSDGNLIVQPWGDGGDSPLTIGYFSFFFD